MGSHHHASQHYVLYGLTFSCPVFLWDGAESHPSGCSVDISEAPLLSEMHLLPLAPGLGTRTLALSSCSLLLPLPHQHPVFRSLCW